MRNFYRGIAGSMAVALTLSLVANANAAVYSFIGNVTQGPGDMYYGNPGNNNGGFAVSQFAGDHLELGLRAHTRYPVPSDTNSATSGLMNQGNGTYGAFPAGAFGPGSNRSSWNFDFSINTSYDDAGTAIANSGLSFFLYIDYDPSAAVGFGSQINALTAFPDNYYGDNLSETGNAATGNVVQNSENMGFAFVSPAFNLNQPGLYDIALVAVRDGVELGRSQITVAVATPEPASMAIWGLGALGCAVAGYRRRKVAA